ncbi:hypothetical protein ATO8_18689 [Roseivivax marinus]|uniref:Uncharacterized protein n=1 Tax=Roseivivax marinus TaxID=1379903 RepID=W4HGF7_9RHOB|nr:hypothetical protein ATO8_18689 [Roseivivax marinus]
MSERIDAHWFMTWERRRWLNSDMRLRGTPECRAYYFDLINIAFDHSPIGTLPTDTSILARLVMCEPSHFAALCQLEFGPLHNWMPYLCDNGEIRLGHRFVVATLTDAVSRREDNRARTEAANAAKRRQRLRETVAGLSMDASKNDAGIRWMDEWLVQQGCTYRSTGWVERALMAWSEHRLGLGLARQRSTG